MKTFFRYRGHPIPILTAIAVSLGMLAVPDLASSQTIGVRIVPAVLAAGDGDAKDQAPADADTEPQFTRGLTRIDSHARRILRDMGSYLAAADEFTFVADITRDTMMPDGQMVQFGGVSNVAVRRPDRMHSEYRGDERETSAICDGRQFFAHNLKRNTYTVLDVPPKLGDAIDLIVEEYSISVPIADFLYEDPYEILIENIDSGYVLGRHAVDGHMCHHLAFRQLSIDWQIWIEDGPRPVPRKLIITYREELGAPQYTARFLKWDFDSRVPDQYFEIKPPEDADQIDFLRNNDEEED